MLADAPGVGKTGQALIATHPAWKVLIVCPATVKNQWMHACADWINRGSIIVKTGGDKLDWYQTVIVNYDLMIRDSIFAQLRGQYWDLIIFDEAHKLKSMSSKRTKCALSVKGLRSRATRIWFLTGTPIKNRTIDLYPILRACAPELLGQYKSYLSFAYRYCGAYQDRFGVNTMGASRTEELRERLKPFMLRREKRDVLTELPPRVISKIDLECTPEAEELIRQEEMKTIEAAGDDDPALFKLGEIARIRQVLALHKVKIAVEYIRDLLDEEQKIVVFYHHKAVLDALRNSFQNVGNVFIDGSIDPQKRGNLVNQFNTRKEIRLFFGQMQACGEAIDGLQDTCSTCVFVEPSWSHTDIEQCIGRLERSGQRSDINVHILTIKNTLESRMMDVVTMKLKVDQKLYNQKEIEMPKPQPQKKLPLNRAAAQAAQRPAPPPAPETTDPTMPAINAMQVERLVRCAEIMSKALTVILDVITKSPGPVPAPAVHGPTGDGSIPMRRGPSTVPTPPPAQQEDEDQDPQPAEPVDPPEAEVTEDAVRARAADVCALSPDGTAKTKVMELIKKIGGGKIADLKTPEKLKKALAGLDTLYIKLSGTNDV